MNDDALLALIARWEALAEQTRQQMRLDSANDISRAAYYEGVVKTYRAAINDLRALLAPAATLQRAGLFARALTLYPDNVFTAVFSRLQPLAHDARIRQLTSADPRVVIIDHGTLRDSGDIFIDFAFS